MVRRLPVCDKRVEADGALPILVKSDWEHKGWASWRREGASRFSRESEPVSWDAKASEGAAADEINSRGAGVSPTRARGCVP